METWALKGSLFCDLFKIIGQPDWNEAIKSFAKIFHVLVVAILVVSIISIWIIPTIFALVLLQINVFGNLHDVNGVFFGFGDNRVSRRKHRIVKDITISCQGASLKVDLNTFSSISVESNFPQFHFFLSKLIYKCQIKCVTVVWIVHPSKLKLTQWDIYGRDCCKGRSQKISNW